MIVFPNAKVNIGLHITDRRADGYHNIITLMIPIPWCDILEIVPSAKGSTTLISSGRSVNCPAEKNLVMKAYRHLNDLIPLPPLDIYLRKIIPDGAGLGGGSSDAAFTIMAINQMLKLGLSQEEMAQICAKIGSDCPFFIYNKAMIATGTGTTLQPADKFMMPDKTHIVIVKPDFGISTAEAYAGVKPKLPVTNYTESFLRPVSEWPMIYANDFEESIVKTHPEINLIKKRLYDAGAYYASMSGSGSAVFGLFSNNISLDALNFPNDYIAYSNVINQLDLH